MIIIQLLTMQENIKSMLNVIYCLIMKIIFRLDGFMVSALYVIIIWIYASFSKSSVLVTVKLYISIKWRIANFLVILCFVIRIWSLDRPRKSRMALRNFCWSFKAFWNTFLLGGLHQTGSICSLENFSYHYLEKWGRLFQ